MIRPDTIIGLYSPAPGAGKSTAADALVAVGAARLSFAAPLKGMMVGLLRSTGTARLRVVRKISNALCGVLTMGARDAVEALRVTLKMCCGSS